MTKRILIVDDDDSSRFVLREFLTDADYDVEGAATCADALEATRTSDFSMVILDWNLPDGTGLDLLATLRRERPHLKALVLSGERAEDIHRMCAEMGLAIQGSLMKPFALGDVLEALHEC